MVARKIKVVLSWSENKTKSIKMYDISVNSIARRLDSYDQNHDTSLMLMDLLGIPEVVENDIEEFAIEVNGKPAHSYDDEDLPLTKIQKLVSADVCIKWTVREYNKELTLCIDCGGYIDLNNSSTRLQLEDSIEQHIKNKYKDKYFDIDISSVDFSDCLKKEYPIKIVDCNNKNKKSKNK